MLTGENRQKEDKGIISCLESWDQVVYDCLGKVILIGHIFLRLLLDPWLDTTTL